ncbi:uncharacterized protein [Anabrus simplex]|uniref:uncharacterized protein n=1 Tax=Anabrus simplex TaxID=316456 RepID=UPI0035A26523
MSVIYCEGSSSFVACRKLRTMREYAFHLTIVLYALGNTVQATLDHPLSCDVVCRLELCIPVDKRDCDGEIRHNATMCGCCPNCIRYIDEGRACGHYEIQFPKVATTKCRPPLECLGGHCTKPSLFRRGMRPQYVARLGHPYSAKKMAMYSNMWK